MARPGRDQRALARLDRHRGFDRGQQVHAGRTGGGVGRQRQVGIVRQTADGDLDGHAGIMRLGVWAGNCATRMDVTMSNRGGILIETAPVATDEVRALIDELDRTLSAEYPPEQRHGLALAAIFQPHIRIFFLARLEVRRWVAADLGASGARMRFIERPR